MQALKSHKNQLGKIIALPVLQCYYTLFSLHFTVQVQVITSQTSQFSKLLYQRSAKMIHVFRGAWVVTFLLGGGGIDWENRTFLSAWSWTDLNLLALYPVQTLCFYNVSFLNRCFSLSPCFNLEAKVSVFNPCFSLEPNVSILNPCFSLEPNVSVLTNVSVLNPMFQFWTHVSVLNPIFQFWAQCFNFEP